MVANVDSLDYFLKEEHLRTQRTKRVALPDGDFIFPLHSKKPVLDLQGLEYQPEEDDEDDPPDGDDGDDDPGSDKAPVRKD